MPKRVFAALRMTESAILPTKDPRVIPSVVRFSFRTKYFCHSERSASVIPSEANESDCMKWTYQIN